MPVRMRLARVALVASLAAGLLLVPAVAPARAADSTWALRGPRLQTVRTVVALGDSVPSGAACGCLPYPALVARLVSSVTAPPVRSYDDARSGSYTATLLAALRTSATVRAHVRAAQVVVVEVGANDLGPERRCGTTASCYERQVPAAIARLARVVSAVRSLTVGRQAAVVLLGYWNVWRDGRRAAAYGSAYVRASVAVTQAWNAAVRSLARRTSSAYVDLWLTFRGTTSRDDTALLAADGDHPDAAGHRAIASAVTRVLASGLARIPYPAVVAGHLVRGATGSDVTTYQEAVHELLVRVHRLGALDPHGITGTFDAATVAMTEEAYAYEAQTTGDAGWAAGDTGVPGAGLLRVLGVRVA